MTIDQKIKYIMKDKNCSYSKAASILSRYKGTKKSSKPIKATAVTKREPKQPSLFDKSVGTHAQKYGDGI